MTEAQEYEFFYLRGILNINGFEPFVSFPEIEKIYQSTKLFPFFQNRVMNRTRPEYEDFVRSLNLNLDAEPFEVLARSGGHRATDQIEVFPEPEREAESGIAQCRFFLRGIRYVDGAFEFAQTLRVGEELKFIHEPANVADQNAIRVEAASGQPLGYVPRYFTGFVNRALAECNPSSVHLFVDHVGQSEKHHTRLMLRFECCWLETSWPFESEEFQPLHRQPISHS